MHGNMNVKYKNFTFYVLNTELPVPVVVRSKA